MFAKSGLITAPSLLRLDHASSFEYACRQPFGNQPDDSPVANPMLDEPDQPFPADLVEKGLNVAIEHPVDRTILMDSDAPRDRKTANEVGASKNPQAPAPLLMSSGQIWQGPVYSRRDVISS